MKKTTWMCVATLGWLAASCGSVHEVKDHSSNKKQHSGNAQIDEEDEDGDESDEAIALDQVPEAIKKAALAAVPGLALVSAEKETEDGSLLYSLEGNVGGERVEVEVRASDSKVTEIERGEDDED